MTSISVILILLAFGAYLCNIEVIAGTTCESQDGERSIECDDSEACCETNGKLKCCNAAWVWIIIVIIILVVIGCCCCCCYFIGRSVYQSNSTPVTVQTVRTVEITPSNKQFYTKTTPFNQPSSNRLSIPSAPPSNNYPSIPDAPPSSNHPFIPNDAPPKYSEAIQTSVKTPPSGETEL